MLGWRQSLVDLGPRGAAIGRLVDPTAGVIRFIARIVPAFADPLPGGRVERVGISGIHHEINRAGPLIDVQHFLPGLAPVNRLVDATILVVCPLVTRSCHVHRLGIGRMNDNARNRVSSGQPHMRPCLSCVSRPIDPCAGHRAAEDIGLPRSDPHDIRIGRCHGDGTDRGRSRVFKDRFPRGPFVVSLPNTAGGRRHVHRVVLPTRQRDCHIGHAATDIGRPQELPREVLEQGRLLQLGMLLIRR